LSLQDDFRMFLDFFGGKSSNRRRFVDDIINIRLFRGISPPRHPPPGGI